MKLRTAAGLAALALSAFSWAQGGQQGFGGGFGGGGAAAGEASGPMRENPYTMRIREIEAAVNEYLDTPEVKNILTPGEYSEWTLKLKAGQVVYADARSDAFDPALEIVANEKDVLATNDDRFPGDQRPLLLWRCTKDGEYKLRARCFHDKSGGQLFARMKVFETADLVGDKPAQREFVEPETFLVRVPMKAGQIKELVEASSGPNDPIFARIRGVIAPNGLPDIELAEPLNGLARNPLMAAVDGDYYVVAEFYANRKGAAVIRSNDLVPQPFVRAGDNGSATAKSNSTSVWTLVVKKGEALMLSQSGTHSTSGWIVAERPDVSRYDVSKDETNPFFPPPNDKEEEDSAVTLLPSRARDQRTTIFVAQRDTTLWIATNGDAAQNKDYTVALKPAAAVLAESADSKATLQIGNNDYWAFESKAGDVIRFSCAAQGFAQRVRVIGPDLRAIYDRDIQPDEAGFDWNLVVERPGRYLVAVSAIGDGGGGSYSLRRDVLHAQEFKKGSPAVGDFSSGLVEVWKFTATPDDPLLLHWRSVGGGYNVSIRDENGAQLALPRTGVANNEQYGVLHVGEKRTYVIVLTLDAGLKAQYRIELLDLPGRGG